MEHCSNCFHGHIMLTGETQAGQMICRLNPPTPYPVQQQTRGGVQLQIIPLWAIVTKNDVCGQWEGVEEETEQPKIKLEK